MHGIDAQRADGVRAQLENVSLAKKSIAGAARGAPSQLMQAAFARGSAALLATSPRQEGQCGGVERVEHEEARDWLFLYGIRSPGIGKRGPSFFPWRPSCSFLPPPRSRAVVGSTRFGAQFRDRGKETVQEIQVPLPDSQVSTSPTGQ